MKKVALGLLLCLSASTTLTDSTRKHERINLNSMLISFVDGTDYINIGEIFDFASNILALLNGTHVQTIEQLQKSYKLEFPEPVENYADEQGKANMVWFQDRYVNLTDLVEYEKSNPNDPAIQDALTHACSHFEKFSEDYVEDIETAKSVMIKIITNWSELRNRPHSLLLDWSNVDGNERDSLYATMTNAKKFDTFLYDLLLFLKDFVQNCPKSHKTYREQKNNKK